MRKTLPLARQCISPLRLHSIPTMSSSHSYNSTYIPEIIHCVPFMIVVGFCIERNHSAGQERNI